MSQYLTVSKSPLYSFIFTLPVFLLYEVGIFLISSRDIDQLRNGADVLMRQVLESFGIYGMYGFGGTFLIGFLIAFIRQKKNLRTSEIESRFLLIMSSAIFSIFHFFGSYGDTFSFPLFFVRFFAGIFLAMIYIFRGFGITAYAHSIYDLFVLVYITTND